MLILLLVPEETKFVTVNFSFYLTGYEFNYNCIGSIAFVDRPLQVYPELAEGLH
jgi:hypothetical protein